MLFHQPTFRGRISARLPYVKHLATQVIVFATRRLPSRPSRETPLVGFREPPVWAAPFLPTGQRSTKSNDAPGNPLEPG